MILNKIKYFYIAKTILILIVHYDCKFLQDFYNAYWALKKSCYSLFVLNTMLLLEYYSHLFTCN